MKKVRLFNIDWDTDGETVSLPTDVTVEVDEDFDAEEEAADLLTDKYGWCVKGCEYANA